ncbi:dihydrofolate reductase [Sphingobacteriaceae bacterium]|nr:dihydrofolate reductase [Sphingobacteriaceae bacterium]
MRKIIVMSMISLDGVMQAPGGSKEDKSEGFKFGGWTQPYSDKAFNEAVKKELKPATYLLGRKTFEIWENYWPEHADFWPGINEGTKYVFSKTRKKSDWKHTEFLKNIADIKKLKSSKPAVGKSAPKTSDIHVWGSSKLIHLLLQHDLVDELHLKIYPLVLGKGKKLFDTTLLPASFTLVNSSVTTTGVILANYKRRGKVKTGTIKV